MDRRAKEIKVLNIKIVKAPCSAKRAMYCNNELIYEGYSNDFLSIVANEYAGFPVIINDIEWLNTDSELENPFTENFKDLEITCY